MGVSIPGQQPSFTEYVAARSSSLLRFAYVLTGDSHQAEDVLQTALIKAYRHWSRVCAAEHPDAYMRRVIVNTHLSSARRRRLVETLTAAVPERAGSGTLDDPADLVSERDMLDRALARLPARQRAVLVLRHYAGYDDDAIAEALGCSVGAARVLASRGAATLRHMLTSRSPQATTTGDPR